MAAADPIGAIRAGLAANLCVLEGIQVSAYVLTNPTPPTIHVFPAQTVYDRAMVRGADELTFTVQALMGDWSDIGAQKNLDLLLAGYGPTSVKEALESDPTLGGAAMDTRVMGASGHQKYAVGAAGPLLGCEWTVDVWIDPSP